MHTIRPRVGTAIRLSRVPGRMVDPSCHFEDHQVAHESCPLGPIEVLVWSTPGLRSLPEKGWTPKVHARESLGLCLDAKLSRVAEQLPATGVGAKRVRGKILAVEAEIRMSRPSQCRYHVVARQVIADCENKDLGVTGRGRRH